MCMYMYVQLCGMVCLRCQSRKIVYTMHSCKSSKLCTVLQHDIVYTFCHPMLRDEQDMNKTSIEKLRGIQSSCMPFCVANKTKSCKCM